MGLVPLRRNQPVCSVSRGASSVAHSELIAGCPRASRPVLGLRPSLVPAMSPPRARLDNGDGACRRKS